MGNPAVPWALNPLAWLPVTEEAVHFGRGFLVAAAMVGGPAIVTVEGLLLLTASQIFGQRATLFCLGTDILFAIIQSASRISHTLYSVGAGTL